MSLTLTATQESNFKPVPVGTHHATVIRIIDLGTQKTEFQNEIKMQPKILIQWEIHADGDPELLTEDGKPMIVSKRYTASMHSKSQLANDLKSWRGRDFTEEEKSAFNLANILGKTCLLSIVHEQSVDKTKTYANIGSISNKLKSYTPPPTVNEQYAFDLAIPNWELFEKLNEKVKEQIKNSPEYAQWYAGVEAPTPPTPPQRREENGTVEPLDDVEDDIPF